MDGNKLIFSLLRKFHLLLFLLSSEVSLRLTSLSTSIWIVKNQRACYTRYLSLSYNILLLPDEYLIKTKKRDSGGIQSKQLTYQRISSKNVNN